MGYLCGSAVVKFKYCDSRANETQMTGKYAVEMFKWHLLMSKSEAVVSIET